MAVLGAFGPPIAAQRRAASDGDWCADENWGRDRQGFCEVREYTVPAGGSTMTVDASPNGGITVEGTSRGDISYGRAWWRPLRPKKRRARLQPVSRWLRSADRVDSDGPRDLAAARAGT